MNELAAAIALFSFLISVCACNDLPGRPKPGPEVPRPEQIMDFGTLYSQNCAGCHGKDGQLGPATPLANPEYQALIDDATLSDIIANGQTGTRMPAFALSTGGNLSEAQIAALIRGIRARWFKGNVLQSLNPPPYSSDQPGDAVRGKQVYNTQCASCHGSDQGPPGPKGSILDSSFLSLVSDQTIRTTAIVGRPDLGMPDWRSRIPGKPMSDQDITDVVTWISSQRKAERPKNIRASTTHRALNSGGSP
jgi:cytochrome c oxidase cbb3-type subunit III